MTGSGGAGEAAEGVTSDSTPASSSTAASGRTSAPGAVLIQVMRCFAIYHTPRRGGPAWRLCLELLIPIRFPKKVHEKRNKQTDARQRRECSGLVSPKAVT